VTLYLPKGLMGLYGQLKAKRNSVTKKESQA
jgi:urea transport system permease protein